MHVIYIHRHYVLIPFLSCGNREKKNISDDDQEAYFNTFLTSENGGGGGGGGSNNGGHFQAFGGTILATSAPFLPTTPLIVDIEDDDHVNIEEEECTLETLRTPSRSNSEVSTPMASPPTERYPFAGMEDSDPEPEPSHVLVTEHDAHSLRPDTSIKANSSPVPDYIIKRLESDQGATEAMVATILAGWPTDAGNGSVKVTLPSTDGRMPASTVGPPSEGGNIFGDSMEIEEVADGSVPVEAQPQERPRRKRGRREERERVEEDDRPSQKRVQERTAAMSAGNSSWSEGNGLAERDYKQDGEGEREVDEEASLVPKKRRWRREVHGGEAEVALQAMDVVDQDPTEGVQVRETLAGSGHRPKNNLLSRNTQLVRTPKKQRLKDKWGRFVSPSLQSPKS